MNCNISASSMISAIFTAGTVTTDIITGNINIDIITGSEFTPLHFIFH